MFLICNASLYRIPVSHTYPLSLFSNLSLSLMYAYTHGNHDFCMRKLGSGISTASPTNLPSHFSSALTAATHELKHRLQVCLLPRLTRHRIQPLDVHVHHSSCSLFQLAAVVHVERMQPEPILFDMLLSRRLQHTVQHDDGATLESIRR